jgi:pyruvate/2-oxoglutarate/acetoin dehydrogenase E1 component/TPP-dependent pyruvate/acetoin dehydrogenase alpha subunit
LKFKVPLLNTKMTIDEALLENDILVKEKVLSDYRVAVESRLASYQGRRDVMGGRAKFGIFGDGKELAQIALSHFFRKGDFRSGYYRDQTVEFCLGNLTWQQQFAQIYAHADVAYEPNTGGRSMNGHFSTRWIDEEGNWLNQTELYNSVCDVSSTAGQVPRAIGLAYASKLFRENPALENMETFSRKGNEIVFATIGDASTSQGMFWEAMNAAGVLQIPLLMSVWDDGYGISVPSSYQTTKGSISEALGGLKREEGSPGIEIFKVAGWNYPELIETYRKASWICRTEHVPVLVHVDELTQPTGHSSSGSHERYKSRERLAWEAEYDCNNQFKNWILENGFATEETLEQIEKEAKEVVKLARDEAWTAYRSSFKTEQEKLTSLLKNLSEESASKEVIKREVVKPLAAVQFPIRRDFRHAAVSALRIVSGEKVSSKEALISWLTESDRENAARFSTHLYAQGASSPLLVKPVSPTFDPNPPRVDGREIIRDYFDAMFTKDPRIVALGEDIGLIGDVNQGFAGLQEKHGEIRITDTGIRETTIIGQGIGLAMRGLRPVVEIQYFDYVYYALATLTDDLACLRYRTAGGQQAPLIIRTRGHRLEGIWHSGSPLGAMLSSLRGLHVVVPRNFTQAAGLYNTLFQGMDPALVIEPLNAYRQKENKPSNLGEYAIPLGEPDILREGSHVTVVTYGSMCRIVMEAATQLEKVGVDVEVIDVQTLLPFDINHTILDSVKKTNRVVFADEDVPGSASAYMMQQVLETQNAYRWLDSAPQTISAKEHRPAYGSDGDYFSKPSSDEVFERVYALMREAYPGKYPSIF